MQRNTGAQWPPTGDVRQDRRIIIELFEAFKRRLRSSKPCGSGQFFTFKLSEWEDRQEPIADEFQHLTAMIQDRTCKLLKIGVEHRDYVLIAQTVGQFGKTAQV